MLTKFEEVGNKIASVDANVTSLRNEMISRFEVVDAKEKEVESLETLEKGAKAVKG